MTLLLDQMHVLDTLKAAKVSLADDVAIARHAHQQPISSHNRQQQWEEETDFDGVLEFLEDPWACVKQVHSCIKQVNYQHRVVARLVQYICDSLVEKVRSSASARLTWFMIVSGLTPVPFYGLCQSCYAHCTDSKHAY